MKKYIISLFYLLTISCTQKPQKMINTSVLKDTVSVSNLKKHIHVGLLKDTVGFSDFKKMSNTYEDIPDKYRNKFTSIQKSSYLSARFLEIRQEYDIMYFIADDLGKVHYFLIFDKYGNETDKITIRCFNTQKCYYKEANWRDIIDPKVIENTDCLLVATFDTICSPSGEFLRRKENMRIEKYCIVDKKWVKK